MKKVYFLFCILFCSSIVWGQQTYTWNQTGSAAWTLSTNWTPTRTTPLSDDILVFNNGNNTIVTNVPTETIGQLLVSSSGTIPNLQAGAANNVLTIGGGTGTDLSVASGSALNVTGANALNITLGTGATGSITGSMTFSNAAHTLDAADAAAITFNSPSVFTQAPGCTGNVFTAALTPGAIVFTAGTVFRQFAGSNPFGLGQPFSKVVFNAGSLFRMLQNAAPDLDGRTYANFEVNFGAFNQSAAGSNPLTMDTLTITNGTLNINVTGGINIRGDISVSTGKVLTFNPASANTLTLNGIVPQSISSPGTLTFGANEAITINNAAGITLNNNFTVNNLVTFTSGIVTVANPLMLTFGASASVAGASNASFVNGLVSKIGNTAFIFPVGKPNCGPAANVDGYAALAIANFTGGAPTDQFTAEYIRGNPSLIGGSITAPGLDHISRCDYWTFTRDNGSSTVDITLSWDETINNCVTTAPYISTTGLPSLTIAHNDNTSFGDWDAIAVAGSASGTRFNGTVTWGAPQSTTFGAFAIGSIDFLNPLPITVNYFTGSKQNGNHLLNWKVNCNSNSSATMELQRSSDGRNYAGIYNTNATAVQCQQPFSYNDNQPAKGVNYYRLKMTDVNGKISYSNIVSLINADNGFEVMNIAPNPIVNRNFNLNVSAAQKTNVEIVITDMQGRLMQTRSVNMIAGFNTIPVNVSGFGSGTYQVYGVTAEGRSKVLRFVIQ